MENRKELFRQLVKLEAWQLYLFLLKEKFDFEYKKLRNSKRNDVSYGKVCGMLDGIEYAMQLVDEELLEDGNNPNE